MCVCACRPISPCWSVWVICSESIHNLYVCVCMCVHGSLSISANRLILSYLSMALSYYWSPSFAFIRDTIDRFFSFPLLFSLQTHQDPLLSAFTIHCIHVHPSVTFLSHSHEPVHLAILNFLFVQLFVPWGCVLISPLHLPLSLSF